MLSDFNLPSVDHLIEGYHYTEVEYDFAQRCPKGMHKDYANNSVCTDKNILASRRRSRNQSHSKTLPNKPQLSNFENNRKISTGEGDFGWAKKGGKPTLVKWGSVAGIKNNDGTVTKITPA